jgi:hypothetical protein
MNKSISSPIQNPKTLKHFFCFATSLLFALLCGSLYAQQLTGTVTDKETGEILPFANVGILNKGIGTVTNEQGVYVLDISGTHPEDTVRISYLGYQTLAWKVKEYLENYEGGHANHIGLSKRNNQLKEVVIRARDFVHKTTGNTTHSHSVSGGFSYNDLGSEIGVPMRVKRKTWIEDANFNIANNTYDSLFFRVNIYTMKNGMPDSSLLQKPIFVTTKIKTGTLTVDLKPFDLVVDSDFFVSLEWLKDLGKGGLMFSAGIFDTHIYARKGSQGAWEKAPIGFGFYCHVLTEKND